MPRFNPNVSYQIRREGGNFNFYHVDHLLRFRFRFLRVTVRCYVNDNDDVILALEEVLEDVETVLEDNDPLTYTDSTGASQSTAKTTILSVDTDEGVLEPLGVGEVIVEIQY